uniref:CUB domain-containing protein n=1 Tax=Spongospora subterranea TaxID=70186 RepID=A0A0H5R8N7_9EUKA|eukprot:CRZ10480.1 hypothetical protein [Spongospora subterranea]
MGFSGQITEFWFDIPSPMAITKLEITDTFVFSISSSAFSKLTSLQTLNISGNRLISSMGDNVFSKLVQLRYLYIRNNNLVSIDYLGLENCIGLLELDLSWNSIQSQGTFFETAQPFLSLSFLGLEGNQITAIGSTFLESMVYLYGISLNGNRLTKLHGAQFQNNRYIIQSINLTQAYGYGVSCAPLPPPTPTFLFGYNPGLLPTCDGATPQPTTSLNVKSTYYCRTGSSVSVNLASLPKNGSYAIASQPNLVYDNNQDCTFNFRAPNGYITRIKFIYFFTQLNTDVVRLVDTAAKPGITKVISGYDGIQQITNKYWYSTDAKSFSLQFTSDESGQRGGFIAIVDSVVSVATATLKKSSTMRSTENSLTTISRGIPSTRKPSTRKRSTKKLSTKTPATRRITAKKPSTNKPTTKIFVPKKLTTKKSATPKPTTKIFAPKKTTMKKTAKLKTKATTKKISTKKVSSRSVTKKVSRKSTISTNAPVKPISLASKFITTTKSATSPAHRTKRGTTTILAFNTSLGPFSAETRYRSTSTLTPNHSNDLSLLMTDISVRLDDSHLSTVADNDLEQQFVSELSACLNISTISCHTPLIRNSSGAYASATILVASPSDILPLRVNLWNLASVCNSPLLQLVDRSSIDVRKYCNVSQTVRETLSCLDVKTNKPETTASSINVELLGIAVFAFGTVGAVTVIARYKLKWKSREKAMRNAMETDEWEIPQDTASNPVFTSFPTTTLTRSTVRVVHPSPGYRSWNPQEQSLPKPSGTYSYGSQFDDLTVRTMSEEAFTRPFTSVTEADKQ